MPRDAEAPAADATVAQAYIAERDIAWVRFVIIAFNVGLYLLALPHDPARHTLALWVSGMALSYTVFVVAVRPYERFHVLRTSTYTLLTDSALIALWLFATGGLLSPFYPLWAVSLLAVVFRFGPGVVALAAGAYLSADIGMLLVSGDVMPGNGAVIAARGAYILITGALGMLLGVRWQSALRERIRLAHEVQDQEMVLAEAERIRALTDAAFEGICIQQDGIVVEFNDPFAELLGKSRDELLGMDVRRLVDESSMGTLEDRLANPADSEYELWIRHGTEKRRVALQARSIQYRGRPARVAAVRDITERFEAENARALAQERQAEIERLRSIDEFRTQFLNTAAHELNTPLTPIKLQFALMRDEWKGRPRTIELLERNLDRLAALVRDMLDVARLQGDGMRVAPKLVDIVPTLRDVVDTFEASASKQQVHVGLAAPHEVVAYVDVDRLTQILTNLVSNGLQFTPAGGRVVLGVAAEADLVRIAVTDTGSGVTPEQIAGLFQPFGTIHKDAKIPGSGLGLFICKSLAEAMGGQIGVNSDGPEAGTRVWVTLPARAPLGAAAPQGSPQPSDPASS